MYFARTSHVVRGAIVVLVGVLIAQMWPGHRQFLCVVEGMIGERGIRGCLTADTPSRPYFDTLAQAVTGSLCESNCTELVKSDDMRQRMINYHRALAMSDADLSNGQETLPTSLYLWAGYYERLRHNRESAEAHRQLALAVDDVWAYPWHRGVALFEQAKTAYEAADFATADRTLAQSITALEPHPTGDQLRAVAWSFRARIAVAEGDNAFARTAVTEAITIDPENSDYLTLLEQIEQK